MQAIPRLETERLLLRAIQPTDAEAIYSIYSDPQVTALTDMGRLTELQQATALISRYAYWFQNDIGVRWGVILRETCELIGVCCFDTYLPHYHACSLGYDFGTNHWNQGFATEAAAAICRHAFVSGLVTRIERIQAIAHIENVGSMRVLEKIGFRSEGRMRHFGYWNGTYHDMVRFARLSGDAEPLA